MDHPILMSTDMVDATGAGRKTQTRRIINPRTAEDFALMVNMNAGIKVKEQIEELIRTSCPYGVPGDKLYIREKWKLVGWNFEDGEARIEYADGVTVSHDLPDDDKANDWLVKQFEKLVDKNIVQPVEGEDPEDEECYMEFVKDAKHPFSPSIHLPKWCSRYWLENKKVRIERLQDISEEDAIAEGIKRIHNTTSKVYKNYLFKDDVLDPIGSYSTLWEKLHGKESWKENPWVWVIDFKNKKYNANAA